MAHLQATVVTTKQSSTGFRKVIGVLVNSRTTKHNKFRYYSRTNNIWCIDINATTFDIDASDDVTIDTSDTTGGIKIGANVSGVPVTVGHTTSEVTVGDNLTVTGNLTVNGTTTTVNSTTVSIADPIFEIGSLEVMIT